MRPVQDGSVRLLTLLLIVSSSILPAAAFYHPNTPTQTAPTTPPSEQALAGLDQTSQESRGGTPLIADVNVATLSPSNQHTRVNGPDVFPTSGSPAQSGPTAAPPAPSTTSNSTIGVSALFNGINATLDCCISPPDVELATGPNHVVEFVNVDGEIFTKQGILLSTFPLNEFFQTDPTHAMSDPKIIYDTASQRWFASIIDYAIVGGQDSDARVMIAASASNDPTGTWHIYKLTGAFSLGPNPVFGVTDQPLLGVSDNLLAISVNDFALRNSNGIEFIGDQYWIINKADLTTGAPTAYYSTFGPDRTLFSVHPVQSLSPTTTQYMVTVGAANAAICVACSSPRLLMVTGTPPGNITIRTIPLPIQRPPPPPITLQPGSEQNNVDVPDTRVQDAVWSQGTLWFTLNNGCTPLGDSEQRTCARLVQFDTTHFTVQQDFNYGAKDTYYFYPSISLDSSGNLVLVYGFSSLTSYPSVAVTGRRTTDPANSLAPARTIVNGTGPETSGRYGDYFEAATDPTDRSLVWVAGEYIADQQQLCFFNCWATKIASASMTGYAIAADPEILSVQPGSSASTTLKATGLNQFTGPITISASSKIPGLIPTVSQGTIALGPSETSQTTVTITAAGTVPPGRYDIPIDTKSGTFSRSLDLQVLVPDFFVTASPNSTSILTGPMSPVTTLTVSSPNGFQGQVQLSSSTTPPNILTCTLTPATVTLQSQPSSTLACGSTTSGTYTVTVTAAYGQLTRAVQVNVTVSPFDITLNPPTIILQAGTSSTTQVILSSIDGFSGLVNMSVQVFRKGPTLSLTNQTVNLGLGQSSSLGLRVFAGTEIGGNFTITLTGKIPGVSFSKSFLLQIQDFLILYPSTVLASPETTVLVGFNVTSVNGFRGNVTLTSSIQPTGLACSLNQYNLTLGLVGNSTVLCSGTPGTYVLKITATSGPVSHSVLVRMLVLEVSISTSPSIIIVPSSSYSQATVTLQALGLQGGVLSTLSASGLPDGTTIQFGPNPLLVFSSSPATSILTIAADASVPPGVYNFTLTGKTHGLVNSVRITLRVLQPQISFSQSQTFAGYNVSYSLNATVGTLGSSVLIQGIGAMTVSNITKGTRVISSNSPVVTLVSEDGFASYVLQIPTQPFMISIDCRVDIVNDLPSCTLSRTLDINHDGTITDLDSTALANSLGCTQPSPCYDPSLDINGDGTIDQADLDLVLLFSNATVLSPPMFQLSPRSLALSFPTSSSGTVPIDIVNQNGFNGAVSFSTTTSAGLECAVTPTIALAAIGPVQLSCSSQTSGIYNATITAVSGILSNSLIVPVNAVPFSLTTSSNSLVLHAGTSVASNVTITGLAGFSGNINLSITTTPGGPTVHLNNTTISLAQSGIATVTMTTSTTSVRAGNYTVTLNALSGDSSISTNIVFRIVDFRLSGLFSAGIPVNSTLLQEITVTGLNGFTGTVALRAVATPSGLDCSISNVTITAPRFSNTAELACPDAHEGAYAITITASDGTITRKISDRIGVYDYLIHTDVASVTVERGSFTTANLVINLDDQYPLFTQVPLESTTPQGIFFLFSQPATGNMFGNGVAFGIFRNPPPKNTTIALTIVVDSSVPVGSYIVTVTAFGSRVIRPVSIKVTVPNFQVSADSSLRLRKRSIGISTVTLTTPDGFTGNITLTTSALAVTRSRGTLFCWLSPSIVSLDHTTASTTLYCVGTPGRYNLTITGAAESISHSIKINVAVTG